MSTVLFESLEQKALIAAKGFTLWLAVADFVEMIPVEIITSKTAPNSRGVNVLSAADFHSGYS